MTWNYRVIRQIVPSGTSWFTIREVYYDASQNIEGWTAKASTPGGETLEELKSDLTYMLNALKAPIIDYDKLKQKKENKP